MTYFKPKNMGDVRLLLGGIDDNEPVALTSGVQLPSTVRTVGDLRRASRHGPQSTGSWSSEPPSYFGSCSRCSDRSARRRRGSDAR